MRDALTRFRHSHEFFLLVVTLALILILGVSANGFFTLQNLFDLLTSYAFTGILAAGLLVVLVSGGIDISFTASATVAQYVALTIANNSGIGWIGVFAIAIAVGVICGLINAILVTNLKISSIIVTISTLNIFYGILIFVTHGNYIYSLPDWFGSGIYWVLYTDADENQYAINLQILALIFVFVLTWALLTRTNIGRQIYAMGGNPDAAQRLGFNVFRLNLLSYGYMGLTAGIASLIQAQLAQSVAPTVLVGKELHVLAVVILGGASLLGGVGSVLGTVLGLVLLAVMENGMIIMGVSSYWLDFFAGLVILLAVSSTARAGMTRRAGSAAA
jgi:simple sugar transport system permease protein